MDPKSLVKLAKSQGWTVTRTTAGHTLFWAPGADLDGRPTVTGSGTPSDHRSTLNLAAQLRRAGLAIPHKGRTPKKGK